MTARIRTGIVMVGFVFSACLLAQSLFAKDDDGESVGDLMERVHKGRRSPMRQTEQQLAQYRPQWPIVDQQLPAFGRMAEALRRARKAEVRDAADGYVTSVTDLAKAVRARNVRSARLAFQALTESCGDCHYKRGPGGKLDDD